MFCRVFPDQLRSREYLLSSGWVWSKAVAVASSFVLHGVVGTSAKLWSDTYNAQHLTGSYHRQSTVKIHLRPSIMRLQQVIVHAPYVKHGILPDHLSLGQLWFFLLNWHFPRVTQSGTRQTSCGTKKGLPTILCKAVSNLLWLQISFKIRDPIVLHSCER